MSPVMEGDPDTQIDGSILHRGGWMQSEGVKTEREENTGGEKDECSSQYKDTERKTILLTTSTRHTASVL